MSTLSKKRLTIVGDEDELKGKAPPLFERLARRCSCGDSDHKGLITIGATLTKGYVATLVPPSAQKELAIGSQMALLWIEGKASEREVKQARQTCFEALSLVEEATASAIARASEHLGFEVNTPLDHHAEHVLKRYAILGAHFTVSALCHLLDAIEQPALNIDVLQDLEGAQAYQATGLGSARHPAFRKAAMHQAEWESAKTGLSLAQNGESTALTVQVFHEYLGGRWRVHADAYRLRTTEFVQWALGGRPRA